MKLERRTFVRVDDETWIELEDFKRRWPDREPTRIGSCFAVFFPDLTVSSLRSRVHECRYVDVVENVKPAGAWLTGGYHWLEQALAVCARIDAEEKRARSDASAATL